MKEIKITSLNKLAFLLTKSYFKEEDFKLDGNQLVLVAEVGEDYKELAEEYKQFEAENREFLKAFKQLKLIRNALLEQRQEQEIEE